MDIGSNKLDLVRESLIILQTSSSFMSSKALKMGDVIEGTSALYT